MLSAGIAAIRRGPGFGKRSSCRDVFQERHNRAHGGARFLSNPDFLPYLFRFHRKASKSNLHNLF